MNLGAFVDEKPVADKTEKKEKKLGAGAVLNAAAYPISAAVGYHVLHSDVIQESYEGVKEAVFSNDRDGNRENLKKAWNNPDGTPNPKAKEEFTRIRPEYNEKRVDEFSKRGWKNIKDHFKTLPVHAQNKVIINALTASGITLGALLMVANSKNVFNDLFGNGDDNGKSR